LPTQVNIGRPFALVIETVWVAAFTTLGVAKADLDSAVVLRVVFLAFPLLGFCG